MNEGRVDGIGTHKELLASNEIYRDVYGISDRQRKRRL